MDLARISARVEIIERYPRCQRRPGLTVSFVRHTDSLRFRFREGGRGCASIEGADEGQKSTPYSIVIPMITTRTEYRITDYVSYTVHYLNLPPHNPRQRVVCAPKVTLVLSIPSRPNAFCPPPIRSPQVTVHLSLRHQCDSCNPGEVNPRSHQRRFPQLASNNATCLALDPNERGLSRSAPRPQAKHPNRLHHPPP